MVLIINEHAGACAFSCLCCPRQRLGEVSSDVRVLEHMGWPQWWWWWWGESRRGSYQLQDLPPGRSHTLHLWVWPPHPPPLKTLITNHDDNLWCAEEKVATAWKYSNFMIQIHFSFHNRSLFCQLDFYVVPCSTKKAFERREFLWWTELNWGIHWDSEATLICFPLPSCNQ